MIKKKAASRIRLHTNRHLVGPSGIGEDYLSLLGETIHAHSTATLRLNKIEGNVQKRMIDTCECRNFAMLTKRLTTRTIPKASRSREQKNKPPTTQANSFSTSQRVSRTISPKYDISKPRLMFFLILQM